MAAQSWYRSNKLKPRGVLKSKKATCLKSIIPSLYSQSVQWAGHCQIVNVAYLLNMRAHLSLQMWWTRRALPTWQRNYVKININSCFFSTQLCQEYRLMSCRPTRRMNITLSLFPSARLIFMVKMAFIPFVRLIGAVKQELKSQSSPGNDCACLT